MVEDHGATVVGIAVGECYPSAINGAHGCPARREHLETGPFGSRSLGATDLAAARQRKRKLPLQGSKAAGRGKIRRPETRTVNSRVRRSRTRKRALECFFAILFGQERDARLVE